MNGLAVLREAVRTKQDGNIKVEGDFIQIGESKFPKDVDSTWRATGGAQKGKLYKLHDLVFYWQNKELGFGKYVALTRTEKRALVSNLDIKDLQKYLKGEIETANQIESIKTSAAQPTKKQKVADGSAKAIGKPDTEQDHKDAARKKPSKQKPVLDTIFEREVVSLDRTSILSSSNKSFASVLDLFTQAQKKELKALDRKKQLKEAQKKLDRYADKSKSKMNDPALRKEQKRKEYEVKKKIAKLQQQESQERKIKGNPIIIVPSGGASMITIHNAVGLLQDGAYVSTADIKRQGQSVKKGMKVIVKHPTQERKDYSVPEQFEVVDNCRRFTSKEWARVVCVFTDGAAWQFKDWKYSTPLDAFAPQHSLGIHLFLDDRPIEPVIKTWNVTRLAISKKKRHLDRILYADFWRLLDEYLIVRRREFVRDLRKGGTD